MKKVKIIWNYEANSIEGTWKNSEDPEYVFFIDNFRDIDNYKNKKNIAILYEPRSILVNNYLWIANNLDKFYKVFTHNINLCDNKKIFHIPPFFPSWIPNNKIFLYKKDKLVSMIASDKVMCRGHIYRQKICDSFPYKDHLFGRGRNFIENKIDGLKDYMFSVAMENEISDIYYTEKILDCFLTGTIPIYWGTSKIKDIFNPDGILFLDEIDLKKLNEDIYKERISAVKENLEIAKKINKGSNHMVDFIVKNLEND